MMLPYTPFIPLYLYTSIPLYLNRYNQTTIDLNTDSNQFVINAFKAHCSIYQQFEKQFHETLPIIV
jgi:hypothetical protein